MKLNAALVRYEDSKRTYVALTETRLSNSAIFHVHKHLLDTLDMVQLAQNFIYIDTYRMTVFRKF